MSFFKDKPYSLELHNRINKAKRLNKGIHIKPMSKDEIILNTRPKIPKSGISLYGDFYIRKFDGAEVIYHKETSMLVARINKKNKSRVWIDENYDEIHKRIQKVLDNE